MDFVCAIMIHLKLPVGFSVNNEVFYRFKKQYLEASSLVRNPSDLWTVTYKRLASALTLRYSFKSNIFLAMSQTDF